MACLKCGSAWTTLKGKDKISCPECCKQQRHKAMTQGLLPKEKIRPCGICGSEMALTGSAISATKYCEQCRPIASRQRGKKARQRIARGDTPKRIVSKSIAERLCAHCGSKLGCQQKKYCNRECFYAARNAGTQAWDRTNQLESSVKRCGIQISPSKKGLSRVLNGFSGFLRKLRAFQRRTKALHCLACDAIARHRSQFCSKECMKSYSFTTSCKHCGCEMTASGWQGPKSRSCSQCLQKRLKQANREARKKYGKNHRRRARHHGVEYVAFPVKYIYERDGYKCQICGKQVFAKARYRKSDGKIHSRSPTIDHIVPMSRGGNHEPDNCQTACFMCNSKKGSSGGGQLRLAIAATPRR